MTRDFRDKAENVGVIIEVPPGIEAVPFILVVYQKDGQITGDCRYDPSCGVEFSECLDLALTAAARAQAHQETTVVDSQE